MSPLNPYSKLCLTGTQNETVRKLTLFSAFINRIMMESQNLESLGNVVNRIESRDLIGSPVSSEFGPK